jgi:hypothetical protein
MPLDSRRRAPLDGAQASCAGQRPGGSGSLTVETEQGAFTPDGGSGLGDNSTFIMSAIFSASFLLARFINNAG